jgi:hypothetical protein
MEKEKQRFAALTEMNAALSDRLATLEAENNKLLVKDQKG